MTDFTETRSMLKKAAMAEPGNTPARCCHYNMLEQTENLSKPAKPDEWPHRRRHLAASLEQQQRRLIEYRNRKAGE